MKMVRAGVVFNVDDPDQRKLWKHAKKRPNFSGYVKRLIQRDMEGGQVILGGVPATGDSAASMKSFL